MAHFTRQAIRDSFLRLLDERPLAQITVKDIVAGCGVNRNTFYYYFEDLPGLLEEIIMEDAETLIQAYPTVDRLEDCLMAVVDQAIAKKRAVLHIYHSVNRELYEQYLWRVCDYVIDSYIHTVLRDRKIRESDLVVIRKLLSGIGFGLISSWLKNGMTEDIRGTLERIIEINHGMIEEIISRCEES